MGISVFDMHTVNINLNLFCLVLLMIDFKIHIQTTPGISILTMFKYKLNTNLDCRIFLNEVFKIVLKY